MYQIDIEVIDNFLSPSYFNLIQSLVTSVNHPWYFESTISSDFENVDAESYGFSYGILKYQNEDLIGIPYRQQMTDRLSHVIAGFLQQAKDYCGRDNILSCRFDMVTRSSEKKYQHEPHIDITPYRDDLITAIFYIVDSDAETVIFNEKQTPQDGERNKWDDSKLTVKERILPRENRIVFFNGHYIHTGNSPVNFKRRILLNTNFSSGPRETF